MLLVLISLAIGFCDGGYFYGTSVNLIRGTEIFAYTTVNPESVATMQTYAGLNWAPVEAVEIFVSAPIMRLGNTFTAGLRVGGGTPAFKLGAEGIFSSSFTDYQADNTAKPLKFPVKMFGGIGIIDLIFSKVFEIGLNGGYLYSSLSGTNISYKTLPAGGFLRISPKDIFAFAGGAMVFIPLEKGVTTKDLYAGGEFIIGVIPGMKVHIGGGYYSLLGATPSVSNFFIHGGFSVPAGGWLPAVTPGRPKGFGLLQGEVIDGETAEPIKAVIMFPTPITKVETDESGKFMARLPAGKYIIKVQVEGYKPVTKEIEIVQGKPTTCNLLLYKLYEELTPEEEMPEEEITPEEEETPEEEIPEEEIPEEEYEEYEEY